MEVRIEKFMQKILIKIFYLLFFILLLKFIYLKVDNAADYLFGLAYFGILIIIFQYILINSYDQNHIIIWVTQIILYMPLLFLEYYNIVKVYIIIQILIGIIFNHQQINLLKRKNEEIKYLSFHDEMTGLHNRRYFENKLAELNNPAEHNLSVIIADINNLKTINDNHGHKKGDQYIKSAAELLKSELREKDIISRIGGDEFAIILPHTDKEKCKRIVKRLKKQIEDHPEKHLSIAFGYVHHNQQYNSLEEMIKNADKNMYYNKNKFKEKNKRRQNHIYHVSNHNVFY
ncbi:MAG: GGDEF domain-containing protein [Bacillota bacterium]